MATPSPAILLQAATAATLDARAAWRSARDKPDEESIRSAFRQCVLAARITRRAADVLPDGPEHRRMVENGTRIESAADGLKEKLARIVEDAIDTAQGEP